MFFFLDNKEKKCINMQVLFKTYWSVFSENLESSEYEKPNEFNKFSVVEPYFKKQIRKVEL